jgi:hypothetical protein
VAGEKAQELRLPELTSGRRWFGSGTQLRLWIEHRQTAQAGWVRLLRTEGLRHIRPKRRESRTYVVKVVYVVGQLAREMHQNTSYPEPSCGSSN